MFTTKTSKRVADLNLRTFHQGERLDDALDQIDQIFERLRELDERMNLLTEHLDVEFVEKPPRAARLVLEPRNQWTGLDPTEWDDMPDKPDKGAKQYGHLRHTCQFCGSGCAEPKKKAKK